MSKKHFIALADALRGLQADGKLPDEVVETLARFCASQNGMFKRERWLAYLKGECGPNGGERKAGV